MTSTARRIAQAREIKLRAKAPPPARPQRCTAMGCGRPTQRSAGRGLSERYCRAHQEHFRRHGSHWRRSYLLRELLPYREAARAWLKGAENRPEVLAATAALEGLLAASGRTESAFRTGRLSPKEKARVALARLRQAGKTGRQLLEIVVTAKATAAALGPRGNPEFLHVQIAKLAHRLASGTILRDHEGRPLSAQGWRRSAVERYPRAEGIFMRVLGRQLEERAGDGADRAAIAEVLALVPKGGQV